MSISVGQLRDMLNLLNDDLFISIAYMEDNPMGYQKTVEVADSIEIFPEERTVCINSKSTNPIEE